MGLCTINLRKRHPSLMKRAGQEYTLLTRMLYICRTPGAAAVSVTMRGQAGLQQVGSKKMERAWVLEEVTGTLIPIGGLPTSRHGLWVEKAAFLMVQSTFN